MLHNVPGSLGAAPSGYGPMAWLHPDFTIASIQRLSAREDIADVPPQNFASCAGLARCTMVVEAGEYRYSIADSLTGALVTAWATAGPDEATARVVSFEPIFSDAAGAQLVPTLAPGQPLYYAEVARVELPEPRARRRRWGPILAAVGTGVLGMLGAVAS